MRTRSYPPSRIRNVVLLGHTGAGKTSLAEALLAEAGVVPRPGRVDQGTTVTDAEPEAVKRASSVAAAPAPFPWKDHKVNLLDTPGSPDFAGEVVAALAVADLAVLVVSATDGVDAQARTAWAMAGRAGLPRMVFVNKLDRDRADFDATLAGLRDAFGEGVAPLELPIGAEADFRGVVDLLSDTAITYQDGVPSVGPVPDDVAADEHVVRDALVEGIVVADDAMTARYLDGDVPGAAELEETMARGVGEATVYPVVCGSATRRIGVDRLADFICEIGPAPTAAGPRRVHAGGSEHPVTCDPDGPALAWAAKTIVDPYVGRLTWLRVLSGTLRAGDVLVNPRTRTEERLHGLFTLAGRDHVEVDAAAAGDLVGVAKLADTRTGDTLAPRTMPVQLPPLELPGPVHAVALRPRTAGDDDKLMTALHRLGDEDPALLVRRDDETHQTILAGLGEAHLAVTLERLARRYGVAVDTEELRVRYRETVRGAAEAEGRFKKQSGGHGQFGVVTLRVEPAERGAGFTFVDRIVGGAVPRQYIPAVEKGVAEAMAHGGSHGFPVVDLVVTLLDGRAHSVDSSEMSFKTAGAMALTAALAEAGPVVLEPVSVVEVTVPANLQGDVLGDLSARRGRIVGTDTVDGGDQQVVATVPDAELAHYAIDLRSLTGGAGRFTVRPDHYEPVPPTVVERMATPAHV